ncbi:MAG: hypothetical protein M5U34_41130 [Chloroflexi bacterium]|nr:hypothetical protein [Chloroflexota bacterium]
MAAAVRPTIKAILPRFQINGSGIVLLIPFIPNLVSHLLFITFVMVSNLSGRVCQIGGVSFPVVTASPGRFAPDSLLVEDDQRLDAHLVVSVNHGSYWVYALLKIAALGHVNSGIQLKDEAHPVHSFKVVAVHRVAVRAHPG